MRRAWWVVLPLLAGGAGTAVALLVGDRRIITSETALAWVWLAVGVAGSLVLLVVALVRWRLRAAHESGRVRGLAEGVENQSRLLARLDHELKNPITAILAGVTNLEPSQPAAASIRTQAERLSRLLTDLRRLGELRSIRLETSSIDLEALVDEVLEAVRELPEAAERTVAVAFPRAPRPLPRVTGDPDLLFLALYNLVTNAIKYSSTGDAIDVRGFEEDGRSVVEVADAGRGIPEADQERVWEELARGSTTTDVPGSGLGLPFVRAIVERHGGAVQLRSRAREGTLVRVSLPTERG